MGPSRELLTANTRIHDIAGTNIHTIVQRPRNYIAGRIACLLCQGPISNMRITTACGTVVPSAVLLRNYMSKQQGVLDFRPVNAVLRRGVLRRMHGVCAP